MRHNGSKNLVPFTKDDPRINRNGAPSYKTSFRSVSPKWLERLQHVLFNEPEPVFFDFLWVFVVHLIEFVLHRKPNEK